MLLELMVALGILATVMIPLGFSFATEQRMCRVYYWRAVAMEIVDGEMEALAAGEWRAFQEGARPYRVRAEAAQNLPAGQFLLMIHSQRVRLEWAPANRRDGAPVVRETEVR